MSCVPRGSHLTRSAARASLRSVPKSWFDKGGAKAIHLHTSGHASVADLKAFAAAVKPKMLVPIHGIAWDTDGDGFSNIVRLRDGEPLVI